MVAGTPSESHPMEERNIGALQREHPPFYLSLILKIRNIVSVNVCMNVIASVIIH